MKDETVARIRQRLQDEAAHAAEGIQEGHRRNDPNMLGANAMRRGAFEDAIKILDEETTET